LKGLHVKTIHTPASRFQSILRNAEVAGRTTWRLAKSGARYLTRMPWPVLLVLKFVAVAVFGRPQRRLRHTGGE
jgi:hypothetical protein